MASFIRFAAIALIAGAFLTGCAGLGSYGVQGDTAAGVASSRQHYSADNPSISFTRLDRTLSGARSDDREPTSIASPDPVPERYSVTAAPEAGRGNSGIGPVTSGYRSNLDYSTPGYAAVDSASAAANYNSGSYTYTGSTSAYGTGAYQYNYVGDNFAVIIPPKEESHPSRPDWNDDRDVRQWEAVARGGADRSAASSPRTIIPIWQRGDVKHLGGVSGIIRENVRICTPCVNNGINSNTSTVVIVRSTGTGRR